MAVRLGITGAGQVAQFHSRAIGAGGARVVAVADPDEACGRRLAARIGTKYLSSPDGLRKDPCVPAAVIAIPNATPYEFPLAAIQAGKDVLCEKPMTTNPTDSA